MKSEQRGQLVKEHAAQGEVKTTESDPSSDG